VSAALDLLAAGARSILGRELEHHEIESFGKYLALLEKWQRVHRLVGSTDPEWVVENLFLDSLLFLRVLPSDIISVADLGSGAGFPGIPIKIVRSRLAVALIEARQRRVSFLSTVVRELSLTGARVVSGRAQDAPLAGSFSAVVMRCAGDAEELVSDAERLVVPGGVVVVAGPPAVHELTRGEWVEVPGVRPGLSRRFTVYRT
jgi:16S rRNA (guanine527-N7)-methyltransferase